MKKKKKKEEKKKIKKRKETRSNQTEPIILKLIFEIDIPIFLGLSRFNTSEFSYVNFYENVVRMYLLLSLSFTLSLMNLNLSLSLSFSVRLSTSLCHCLSVCARNSNVAKEEKDFRFFSLSLPLFVFFLLSFL